MPSPADAEEPLHPDDLVGARLRTSLRGFDQLEVRALLNRAADRVRQLEGVVERLRGELEDAQTRTAAVADLDEDALTEALGSETARVLRSAKEAAVEIRGTAEAKAAEILRDAEARSQALVAESEGVYERERARASEAAEEILDKAKAAGRKELEKGRGEGRRLVAEARALRTRMLEDLARRRQEALAQLERMTAARQRLLETYAVVEETLTRATGALEQAEVGAEESVDIDLPGDLAAELEELEALAAAEPVTLEPEGAAEPDDEGEPAEEEPVVSEGEAAAEAEEPPRPTLKIDDLAADPLTEGPAPAVALSPGADQEPVGDGDEERDGENERREGRRTSALRVLRKARPQLTAEPEPDAEPPPGFTVVSGYAADEGVTVIGAPAADEEPEAEGHVQSEGDVEGDVEDDVGAEGDAAVEREAAAEPEVDDEVDVEDLFDRIKAGRPEPGEAAAAPEADELAVDEVEPGAAEAAKGGEGDEAPEESGESADEVTQVFAERDAAVDAALPAIVRAFKRTLGDEQNEVLAGVRDSRGVPRAEEVLPSPDEQRGAYADPIVRPLAAVAQAGAGIAGGGEPDVADLAVSVAASLCDPLRSRVAAVIDESDSDTDDLELADRVSAVYRQWRRQRLDRVADEALRTAFALGVQWSAARVGTELQWTLDPRDETCSPDCEDNALAGPVAAGQPFPAGGLHPPAHAECRCLALPVAAPS